MGSVGRRRVRSGVEWGLFRAAARPVAAAHTTSEPTESAPTATALSASRAGKVSACSLNGRPPNSSGIGLVLTMAAAAPRIYTMPPPPERIPPAGCFSNAGQIGA